MCNADMTLTKQRFPHLHNTTTTSTLINNSLRPLIYDFFIQLLLIVVD